MTHTSAHRPVWKCWLTLSMTFSVLLMGSLACGFVYKRVPPAPYNASIGATGSCRSAAEPDHSATQTTLATVISVGPNTTICKLDPNNGLLMRHEDLVIHGDVAGYVDGLIFLNERGGSDGHSLALCAVRIRDGQQRWCQPHIQAPLTQFSFSPFLNENGIIYVSIHVLSQASVSPTPMPTTTLAQKVTIVFALSETDGSILWEHTSEPGFPSQMLVLGYGLLYTGEQQFNSGTNHVCALHTKDGTQAWCFTLAEPILNGLTVAGHVLYLRTSTDDNWIQPGSNVIVTALDVATGSQRWAISLGASATGAYNPLLVAANGVIYVNIRRCRCGSETATTDDADYLFALNANDGSQLWSTVISTSIWTLVPTNTVLYAGTQLGGGITALRANNGAILWHQRLPEGISSDTYNLIDAMAVSGQTIYVSISYGSVSTLLSVNAQAGRTNWQDNGCGASTSPSSSCYWSGNFPEPAITVLLPA